jgi:hypothetical protein
MLAGDALAPRTAFAEMKTLHVAPGDSAGGSIREALRGTGRDNLLRFLDDLSCGPIHASEPSVRAAWWAQFDYETADAEAKLRRFWDRLGWTDDRLVVWFSRHSARELAFFLAWTEWCGQRPFEVIDVAGMRLPLMRRDGSTGLGQPLVSVSIAPPEMLTSLIGTERPITAEEREACARHWRRLRRENAPFRIVAETGLVSAAADHFDPLILGQATPEWQPVLRIIHHAMEHTSQPYDQVGNVMLHARVVALVGKGSLLTDGDPWAYSSRIRLPDQ